MVLCLLWVYCVTPCVGVWIEIFNGSNCRLCVCVTPCVGVWIEILYLVSLEYHHQSHSLRGSVDWNTSASAFATIGTTVTPCVGVWIEIIYILTFSLYLWSLPAWECGLKSRGLQMLQPHHRVTPCVGVWIEIFNGSNCRLCVCVSLPAWECGLK